MGIFTWLKGKRENPPLPEKAPPALGYRTAVLQGIGAREDQEDAYLFVNDRDVVRIRQEGLFALVADGMGGMASGQEASTVAAASLKESFSQFDRSEDLAPQLRQAMRQASGEIYQRLGGLGGSTAIACVLFQDLLWFASVGDSPLYLLRDQQLNRLNREHTVCTQRYEGSPPLRFHRPQCWQKRFPVLCSHRPFGARRNWSRWIPYCVLSPCSREM